MSNYQRNYAAGRPQMFDPKTRQERALRIVETLKDYYLSSAKLESLDVLDIGSSTGIIDNFLASYFRSVKGIDIDQKAVDYAKKQFSKNNLDFEYGNTMNLTFKPESFDVVICTQIYEHVPNSQKLFTEIYKVLKKGGVCYLAAMNKLWPIEPHYRLPFLSWLPKKLANIYLRSFKKIDRYYENPLSYWGLCQLVKRFTVVDYTPKILASPLKFGYKTPQIPIFFASLIKFFTPTFFWILIKEG